MMIRRRMMTMIIIMIMMRTIVMMITQVRRRRESRELALSLAQQELADVLGRLEAAQERGAEQVDDQKCGTIIIIVVVIIVIILVTRWPRLSFLEGELINCSEDVEV